MSKICTIILLFATVFVYGQSGEAKTIVEKQLREIYGNYYTSLVEEATGQFEFYLEFYKRCEIIPFNEALEGIDNISILYLKDKYNPDLISHSNMTEFNQEEFRVLQYQFDYYNKTDRYFRIYQTNKVLKINKL